MLVELGLHVDDVVDHFAVGLFAVVFQHVVCF